MKSIETTYNQATLLQEGIAAAKAGKKVEARSLIAQVTELDPHNELAWLWLAYLAENPDQAISYLRHVLEINPENEQALSGLKKALLYQGIALAKAGSKSEARAMLSEASCLDSENELVWLWLASVAERPEDAADSLQRALELNPDDERTVSWLNKLRPQSGKYSPVWQCPMCEAASPEKQDRCPDCKSVLTLDNLDAFNQNQEIDKSLLLEAIQRYRSITEEGEDFLAYFNLALAYLNLNQTSDAIRHLQRASELRPDDSMLRSQLEVLQRRRADATGPLKRVPQRIILLVDDSATVRKLVAVTLERRGHRVLVASGAMEAMAKLNETALDLVLLDVTMPHMDGYQLCKLIKGNGATKDIPIVMLSGKDGFFDKVRGRMAGAVGYITKPFEPTALIEAVENYCSTNGRK